MKTTIFAGAALAAAMLLSACGGAESGAPPSGEATAEAAPQQAAAADNPLTTWCMETASQEACECADVALKAAATSEDYEIYLSMAPTYLERRAAGDDLVTAFDAASAEAMERLDMAEGDLRSITSRIGRQHRSAINECER